MTTKTKWHRIILDCEHERWFITPPDPGEELWCPACHEYRAVGPAEAKAARVVHPDGWISQPSGGGFIGTCFYTDAPCDYTARERNFYKLRDRMHAHHMRDHERSRFAPQFETVAIPLPTRPPF